MSVATIDPHIDGQPLAGAARSISISTTTGAGGAAATDQGPSWLTPVLAARMTADLSAETAAMEAARALVPPDDLCFPDDPDCADGPRFLSEEDLYDELPPMSRVDALEWEEWAGVEQDEAEREMLRLKAPAWVFLPPGAELAAALEELRPQCESPVALIEAMKAASRMEAWAAAIKVATIASFVRQRKAQATEIPRPSQLDASGRPIDPERSWAAEIGAALHLSKDTAAGHIDTALHLTGTLRATHAALRCGALTFSKALAISEATRPLPPSAAQAVEAHVLSRAPGQTHSNLRKSLRTQVAKHSAEDWADRHRKAVQDRTCKIVPLPDGMAGLWVVHTADKIQQMWIVVQAMADLAKRGTRAPVPDTPSTPAPTSTPDGTATATATSDGTTEPNHATGRSHTTGADQTATTGASEQMGTKTNQPIESEDTAEPRSAEQPSAEQPSAEQPSAERPSAEAPSPEQRSAEPRSAEQRRADVITDLFDHMLHNGLDWLGRRLPDQHRRRPHIEVLVPITTLLGVDDHPCELTGYGPVPAEMARRIAADGSWRRLLTDPANGVVLEASTTRHDPGALVSETLLARHPVCVWPGCNRTSRECDRDHAIPFAQSGQTSLAGLVPYCEYHHVIKDTKAWGWNTTAHPDGSVTLTAPTGHRYTTVPPARGRIAPSASAPRVEPPPF